LEFVYEDERVVMQCGHCGKRSAFNVRGECTRTSDPHIIDLVYNLTVWHTLQCLTCLQPTLRQTNYIVDDALMSAPDTKVLYPTTGTRLNNLPDTIKRRYMSALKVRDIDPNAYAVLVGRTLEAVCKHEKALGKTLAEKLSNLVDADRIPRPLAEMAQQLRQIRNLGAHDTEDEVTENDVPIILDFIEAILEYLYIAPAKITAVQERLKKSS
jgi:Domain of unknown function (DUF4145)